MEEMPEVGRRVVLTKSLGKYWEDSLFIYVGDIGVVNHQSPDEFMDGAIVTFNHNENSRIRCTINEIEYARPEIVSAGPKSYRKKPVTIEAMLFDGRNTVEVERWLRESGVRVGWSNAVMIIPTLEGRIEASPGDYIIRGVQGEFYPCKPDIFEQTYEEATDE